MTIRASIIGGSGYTGGELCRLLLGHPEIELVQVSSRHSSGKYLHSIHPHLRGRTNLKFCAPSQIEPCDILFLSMPHGESMKNIEKYKGLAEVIIDLSADFRLRNVDLYSRYYRSDHEAPQLLKEFVYGIVEISREQMKSCKFISSAGCNATATILGLLPIVHSDIEIERMVVDLKVGSSEGGRTSSDSSHHPERSGSIRSYRPSGHRHAAEVVDQLELSPSKVSFSATALDMIRGTLATIHLFPKDPITEKELWKIYREYYTNEPFVRIVKERSGNFRYPDPKLLAGTNYCDIGFEVDPDTNRIVIISALDNLMKGAAGQAIQAMNVRFGFAETAGLEFGGLHP